MSASNLTPERIQKRLMRVFTTAFPDVDPTSVAGATMDSVDGWDSIATLTLFTLAEEDLGVKLGYDHIGDVRSFLDLCALVEGKLM